MKVLAITASLFAASSTAFSIRSIFHQARDSNTCGETCIAELSDSSSGATSSLAETCSSVNLEAEVLGCMRDRCPDEFDGPAVSAFLDMFCQGSGSSGGTTPVYPEEGPDYGNSYMPSATGYYPSGASETGVYSDRRARR